tara:strand:+ start:574 stop:1140 length:567 start_codon:yes stop_codon:yes gene_type:complete
MFGERIKKKRLCKMDSNFPLFLKYNYDDTHFKLKVTVNEEITEYTQIKEIRESFGNFFIFTKLNQNIFFERFCEFFSTNEKKDIHFFEDCTVNIECLESISLTNNISKQNDLKNFIKGFLLPKIKYSIFPDKYSTVYSTTQKIVKNENRIYNIKNHQNLYKKELQKGGYTPVEVYLFMKFDFENVFGF